MSLRPDHPTLMTKGVGLTILTSRYMSLLLNSTSINCVESKCDSEINQINYYIFDVFSINTLYNYKTNSFIEHLRHCYLDSNKNANIFIHLPETALPLEYHRLVAQWLVRSVNEGYRITITTHSDALLREINNFIIIHSHQKCGKLSRVLSRYNYDINIDLLDPECVNCYDIDADNNPQKVEINSTGINIKRIDDAISESNKFQDDILDAIGFCD